VSPIFLAFLGTTELIVVLVIVVIFFGLGKLPQVGKQLGEGIRNFKDEVNSDEPPKQLGPGETDAPDVIPVATTAGAPEDVTPKA
jgi:sec-independent protein translocase protein TatA